MNLIKKVSVFLGKNIAKQTIKQKNKFRKDFNDKDIEEIIILGLYMFLKTCTWLILLLVITKFIFYKIIKESGIYNNQVNLHLILIYIYLFFYFIFRRKFGGAHFQNSFICTIFSIFFPIAFSYVALQFNFHFIYIITAYIFSYFSAFYKGVIDSPKKPLTPTIKQNLKHKGVVQLTYVFFFHIILYFNINSFFILKAISNVITLSIFSSFVNLYFGKPSTTGGESY